MITVYPLPPQLPANPYLDLLYGPFTQLAPEIELRRGRPRVELLRLLLGRGPRILHLHFFDEIVQRPGYVTTVLRSLGLLLLLLLMRLRGVRLVWTAHNTMPHELYHARWASFVYAMVERWSAAIVVHSETAWVRGQGSGVRGLGAGGWGLGAGGWGLGAGETADTRYRAAEYGQPDALAQHSLDPHPQILIPKPQWPKKYVVIAHGHYIGHYGPIQERSVSRMQLGLSPDQPVTLCIGALRPYKNIGGLIEAFASLPEQKRGILLIAGWAKDQNYARQLQRQAASVPGVRIDMRYIPDSDIPVYLGAATIVALPYQRLLSSGVLLLALSYARPVLAPDLPSVRELIHDGQEGFLFQPDQPGSLAQILAQALRDPNPEQREAQALARAAEFPWEQSAARLVALYRSVILNGEC